MPEEILINLTSRETRVAMLENGVLQELMIERASRRGLTGNIYMGEVVRVLPGMQAAFIDIGIARTAFLHASDIAPVDSAAADGLTADSDIRDLLREGQLLPVQVIK
ncbi:MAG: S1 RNA-binding domain-containing protein, partial [Gammaproteobacteria bacterium]|nr:S1 RNA-binding domain-containing protein [Gammaproteobacteria bacterium]